MNRRHHTNSPVPFISSVVQKAHQPTDKPVGLWYEINNSWFEWCKSEMPEWICEFYQDVEICVPLVGLNGGELVGNKKPILTLNSSSEVVEFSKRFSQSYSRNNFDYSYINWNKVQNQFSGIEIPEYHWDLRHDFLVPWYYGWDVACGVVWEEYAIKLGEPKPGFKNAEQC